MQTHSCLTIGYQEETQIFTQELPKYFSIEESEVIKAVCKQYMHDGFIFWPKHLDFEYFRTCLNNLHHAIKHTYRQNKSKLIGNIKAKLIQRDHTQLYQVLKFLDNEVVLHCDNTVEADIYYKDTNMHNCLPYNTAHNIIETYIFDIILLTVLLFLFLMMKRLRWD